MTKNNEFHQQYLEATRRGKEMQAANPIVIAARYNPKAHRVVISLSSRVEVMFDPADVEGLENGTTFQLKEIEITPSGFGLYFPRLDADINVLNLLEGFLGSRKWMAARLGAAGGSSRSKPKAAAARANGSLGGRPRKLTASK
jgi:Protein of unknown function (DUF2442)